MTDRPASPGDDPAELASRYLDGDLGADERTAAEADAVVMAWVERFRGIRTALRGPIDVDAGARDAAIAAALAEFDHGSPIESAPAPGGDELAAVRARRAGRLGPWLAAAAAAVALVVGGTVLAGNRDGSDDSAELVRQSAEQGTDSTVATGERSASADMTMSAEAPPAARDEASPADAAASAPATEAAGDATDAPAATNEDAGGAPVETAAGAATTSAAAAASYDEPADLAVLADALPITLPDGTDAPCGDQAPGDLVAVDVFYADRPAAVYRDAQRHTLTAWAVDSCAVLAEHQYGEG